MQSRLEKDQLSIAKLLKCKLSAWSERKSEKKGKKDKGRRKKRGKKDQPSVAKVAKCKLSAQTESPALTKPELKRGKPELKGENRIFREERGGVEQFGRKLKDIKPGALWGLCQIHRLGTSRCPGLQLLEHNFPAQRQTIREHTDTQMVSKHTGRVHTHTNCVQAPHKKTLASTQQEHTHTNTNTICPVQRQRKTQTHSRARPTKTRFQEAHVPRSPCW